VRPAVGNLADVARWCSCASAGDVDRGEVSDEAGAR
jgi:hypothetical protein